MVQLVLRMVAKKGCEQDVLQSLRAVMRPLFTIGASVDCRVLVDASDRRQIYYVEEWSQADDLHQELRSDRFRQVLSIMESSVAAPTLEFRTVLDTRGLDLVEEMRGERASGGRAHEKRNR